MTIIKGINIVFDIVSSYKYAKVFRLPMHLNTRACSVILFGHLYNWNLSLSKGLSCLSATAFYEMSGGFPLGHRKIYKRNSECKQIIWSLKPAVLLKKSKKNSNIIGLCKQRETKA